MQGGAHMQSPSIIFAAALGLTACTLDSVPQAPDWSGGGKADYFGVDDRLDPFESEPRTVAWARSTALVANRSSIQEEDDGTLRLKSTPLAERRGLCAGERFAEQPIGGFCSSFLVAPDLVVTAGHCLNGSRTCSSVRFVFDYAYYTPDQDPTVLDPEKVYACAEVVAHAFEGSDFDQLDYAVIRLDRPVEDRDPLPVRWVGQVSPGAHLTLIGYSDGLPVKIDGRGVVYHATDQRFVSTNDSFAGHSGSAVINNTTGLVEGVHVSSAGTRYVHDEEADCYRAQRCDEATLDGECQGSVGVHAAQWRHHLGLELPDGGIPNDDAG